MGITANFNLFRAGGVDSGTKSLTGNLATMSRSPSIKEGKSGPEGQKSFPSMIKVSRPFLNGQQISYLRNCTGIRGPAVTNNNIQAFQLIWGVARYVKFPIRTATTAMLVYQKALLYNGNRFPFVELVVACLLVASKIEDTLKRTRELITYAYKIKGGSGPGGTGAGSGSSASSSSGATSLTNQQLDESKHMVLGLERQILETIAFDFRVRSSHKYVVSICKEYGIPHETARLSWLITTDAYVTDAVLKVPSHVTAAAAITLALKLSTSPSTRHPIDYGKIQVTEKDVHAVLNDLLDFYIHHTSSSQLGKVVPEVSKYMTLRMELNRESQQKPQSEETRDDSSTLTGLSIRDTKISDVGTVRYILEWEKDHVRGEVLS